MAFMNEDKHDVTLEDIASLCKRRGFIFQGSEIYGGLAGTWDYGPLGAALKRNIEQLWWKTFVEERDDMFGVDAAILMNQKVWQASGHTGAGFADPLVEDTKTGKRFRADHLLEDNGIENPEAMTYEQMDAVIREKNIKSPAGNPLSEGRVFNMMFETNVGPIHDDGSKSYLRPENAQGMFVNFKNVVDSLYPDLPFGLAQSGRVFRNEISPREFIFRVREFNLMEFEYFIHPDTWEESFSHWHEKFYEWTDKLGLDRAKIHELEVPAEDRAHYSKRTVDFEYAFSFGTKEIGALAYRTDFDLKNHMKHSGVSMEYTVKSTNERFVPHVIEPTFGLDRQLLAVLAESYTVDELNGGKRVVLKLPKHLAPIKAAVSPLLKNKPELVEKAREVYKMLHKELGAVTWDDNSNVGKRYRRSDEIGVPAHVTIDFQTLEDNTVTIRDRDTAQQTRVKIDELAVNLK
jgi:glycyl-tRNA synthetase